MRSINIIEILLFILPNVFSRTSMVIDGFIEEELRITVDILIHSFAVFNLEVSNMAWMSTSSIVWLMMRSGSRVTVV